MWFGFVTVVVRSETLSKQLEGDVYHANTQIYAHIYTYIHTPSTHLYTNL